VCGRRPSASRKARIYVRKRPGVGNFGEQNWGISVSAVSEADFAEAFERFPEPDLGLAVDLAGPW
jgi:hypothetical protein